jgi:hypothetical protein
MAATTKRPRKATSASTMPTAEEMIAVLKKPVSREERLALLVEIGLITPDGQLTPRYTSWGKPSRTETTK